MINDCKNILIVRTDRIGDVVLTTPMIKALRESRPEMKISMLVAPLTYELIDGNECIDEIIVDDRNNKHKGLFGYLKLIRLLRSKKFDLAIILHTKKRTNLLCFLSGIPHRLGYKNNKFGKLLNHPIVDTRHKGEQHEAQYCLDVLNALEIKSNDLSLYVPVNENSLQWVDRFRGAHQIKKTDLLIAIHCGASDPDKCWPQKYFTELIDVLIQKYDARIVMIGSADAGKSARAIASSVNGEIIDQTGQTTVGQLAALLMRCNLLVSNDSGPVHIAAGVGTPVVSIFTRNQPGINPERWRPLNECSRVVSVDPSQSNGHSFKKAGSTDEKYLELVGVNEVLEAVDSLFKLC